MWFHIITLIHPDHLGTPRVATENTTSSPVITWEWQPTDAFGRGNADWDPDGDGVKVWIMLRFPGQYYDIPTGKHYNYFRDYDPTLCRYMQSDPIGLQGGPNSYGYVGQNPMNSIDPYGLAEWNGTLTAYTAGQYLGAGRFVFDLVSECDEDGLRWSVKVVAKGGGATLALFRASVAKSPVTFEDPFEAASPSNLVSTGNNSFNIISASAGIPGIAGVTAYGLRLGYAFDYGVSGFLGFDFSLDDWHGTAEIVSEELESCSCSE
jgi:RHS repeat-associated protein